MHWGVEMARKGRASPDRVINAMPLAKLLRHLHNRRQTAARAAWRAIVATSVSSKQSAGLLLYRLKDGASCSVIPEDPSGARRTWDRGRFQKA